MSNDLVQVEYDTLQAISQQFAANAERIKQLQSALRNSFAPLEGGDWQGKGAGAFFNQMNSVIFPSVTRLEQGLMVAQNITNQVMQIFQQAEQEAASLFKGDGDFGNERSGPTQSTNPSTNPPQHQFTGPGLPPKPAPPPAPPTDDGSGDHGTEDAGLGDYLNRELFYKVADAADALGLDNAARNMRHYLNNSGEPLDMNPDQMLHDLPGFQKKSDQVFQEQVINAVNDRIAKEYNGQPMSFQITTPWNGYYATKGESQDWFFATGGFSYAYGAEVTVVPGPDGKPQVTINHQMHVFDRYNWDKGKGVDIAGIRIGDEQLGGLHKAGLAKEYELHGTSTTKTTTYSYPSQASSNNQSGPSIDRSDSLRDSNRRDPDGTRRWGRGDGR